jgi:hypothetical protein
MLIFAVVVPLCERCLRAHPISHLCATPKARSAVSVRAFGDVTGKRYGDRYKAVRASRVSV